MKAILWLAVPLLALAQVTAQEEKSAQPFTISQREISQREIGTKTLTTVETLSRRFLFEPPRNAKLTVISNELRLAWVADDRVTAFNFRLFTNSVARAEAGQNSGVPESLHDRFPNMRNVEDFPCYSAFGPGRGFDVHCVVDGKFKTTTRLARFPLGDGLAEFEVTCPEDQFAQRQMELNRILNSFQIERP
jgi:hypothetical protein